MHSQADTSLFVFHSGDFTINMLVYVDDIVIVSSSSHATRRLLQQFSASFPVKDLGPLNYFLSIKVASNSGGMLLTQHNTSMHMISFTEFTWRILSLFPPLCV
jgi:hypothetical protein